MLILAFVPLEWDLLVREVSIFIEMNIILTFFLFFVPFFRLESHFFLSILFRLL